MSKPVAALSKGDAESLRSHLMEKMDEANAASRGFDGHRFRQTAASVRTLRKWRVGLLLRAGGFIVSPLGAHLTFLQELSSAKKSAAHRDALLPCIAQFAMCSDDSASGFCAHLLSFVEGAQQVDGLEGLFLSCMSHAQEVGDFGMYWRGAYLWRHCLHTRKDKGIQVDYLTFFDRQRSMLTVINSANSKRLFAALDKAQFRNSALANFVRSAGQHDSPIGVQAPGASAAMDRDHCKDVVNTLVQVGGVVLGGVVGGVATIGASGSGQNVTDSKAGRFSLSFGIAVGLGAGTAPAISTAACKDSDANSGAVNSLVTLVTNHVLTVDQALALAGTIGVGNNEGQSPPGVVAGETLDDVLGKATDPYSDLSPLDLLGPTEETPGAEKPSSNDDSEKPSSVSQESWDLVTALADNSGSAGTTGPTGAPAPATETPAAPPADNPDTGPPATDAPAPAPSANTPTPDGDGGGGGLVIGPIGPWAAHFDSDSGGDGNTGGRTPRKKGPGGDAGTPTPDGTSPGGPLALGKGYTFVPAPAAFGRGLLDTSQIVAHVSVSTFSASCIVARMPQFATNGSLETAGFAA